jgi:hypothetical protein
MVGEVGCPPQIISQKIDYLLLIEHYCSYISQLLMILL